MTIRLKIKLLVFPLSVLYDFIWTKFISLYQTVMMETRTCMVIDIQGFKIENKCIAKELTSYDGTIICHYIFRPPFG